MILILSQLHLNFYRATHFKWILLTHENGEDDGPLACSWRKAPALSVRACHFTLFRTKIKIIVMNISTSFPFRRRSNFQKSEEIGLSRGTQPPANWVTVHFSSWTHWILDAGPEPNCSSGASGGCVDYYMFTWTIYEDVSYESMFRTGKLNSPKN